MWIENFSDRSYRSILKWGDKKTFHHPSAHLMEFIKETFGLSEEDITKPHLPGLSDVSIKAKPQIKEADLKQITKIVGRDNVDTSDYERARHAVSYTYRDIVDLRKGHIPYPPDAVVYPRHEKDVIEIVNYCNLKEIPITPFAGRSSVTFGVVPRKKGISLDFTRHMNKVLEIDEVNFTVRAQPGIFGPRFEEILNGYKNDRIKTGFTCGHYPQSFEYSCVGGWVMTRGAGSHSTGYGKIEDMVLAMRVVTPKGIVATRPFPAAAIGPDIDEILLGSEGAFGILTEVTLKLWPYHPENRKMFSHFFKTWEDGVLAMREIMQGDFGHPHMLRISDPEETDVAMKVQGMEGTAIDTGLRLLGYKPNKRVLLIGAVEGDRDFSRLVTKKANKIARKHGGLPLGAIAVKGYMKRRYADPYMREDLMDIGIITDTLETSCTWGNIMHVWESVRSVIKARPRTVCMVHASHAYQNGANLYFIFLSTMVKGKEEEDYTKFHHKIVDAIVKSGGSLSHHHGIGKLFTPWFADHIGPMAFGILKAIKNHVDPNYILNPGGTLGLDVKKK